MLEATLALSRPIDDVFAFFADAHNLDALTPRSLRFEIVTPTPIEMRVGTTIDYKLRLRGIPMRWRSEITVWDPPNRFVDEQRRGPYRWWVHEHWFDERDGQTIVGDRVHYGVPGGAIVHWLFVERDVRSIFAFRARKLKALFNAT